MRDFGGLILTAIMVAIIAALGVGIYFAVQEQNAWEKECLSRGGHVVADSDLVTTVGANGKVGVGSTTDYFCLTDDGRIIGTH